MSENDKRAGPGKVAGVVAREEVVKNLPSILFGLAKVLRGVLPVVLARVLYTIDNQLGIEESRDWQGKLFRDAREYVPIAVEAAGDLGQIGARIATNAVKAGSSAYFNRVEQPA